MTLPHRAPSLAAPSVGFFERPARSVGWLNAGLLTNFGAA